MKRGACVVLLAAVVWLGALSEPAFAWSGGHGGGGGGGRGWNGGGGNWGRHGGGGGRWAWGGRAWWGPAWWGPGWYGYPYAYGNPYPYPYTYLPSVVVQQAPQAYIEQTPPAPQPAPQQYWYYCEDARAYYPYVRSCPQGWMTVVPPTGPPSMPR